MNFFQLWGTIFFYYFQNILVIKMAQYMGWRDHLATHACLFYRSCQWYGHLKCKKFLIHFIIMRKFHGLAYITPFRNHVFFKSKHLYPQVVGFLWIQIFRLWIEMKAPIQSDSTCRDCLFFEKPIYSDLSISWKIHEYMQVLARHSLQSIIATPIGILRANLSWLV